MAINKKEIVKTLKGLFWITIVAVIAFVFIASIRSKNDSKIKEVIVDIVSLQSGDYLLTKGDIYRKIERGFGYALTSIIHKDLNLGRLERVIEEDPFVLDAETYVDGKNQVHINIHQREPIIRIIDDNGLTYYLSKSGLKMPLSKHFTARVLVATGNIPPHVPDFLDRKQHILKDIYVLTQKILQDDFFASLVEQIHISNTGNFILIPKVGKQKIYFGECIDIDDKLKRLKYFYKEGLPYEGWQKYQYIDVRFKNQVVCR